MNRAEPCDGRSAQDARPTATNTISVIVPAYNASSHLPRVLAPMLKMLKRREIDELIVVDDGSRDDSAAVARAAGARVLSTEVRSGPGKGRNLGAAEAGAAIVWFVDSDVVLHDDAAGWVQSCFQDAQTTALFGAYDDTPTSQNFCSQYKNLLHHYHHRDGKREAATFWSGCGAVRKSAFAAVGGFDHVRYPRPSIEDIELGKRLREAGGRICLEPRLRATHLKEWRLMDLVHTDVCRRAVPWAELIMEDSSVGQELNVAPAERARAVLAAIVLFCLVCAAAGWLPWWSPVALLAVAFFSNWRLANVFYARNGWLFALAALCFHQLYYLYSTAAYLWVWMRRRIGGSR